MTRWKANVVTIGSDPEITIGDSIIPYPWGNNYCSFSFYAARSATRTCKDSNSEIKSWSPTTGEKLYDIYRDSTTTVVFRRDGTTLNTHNQQIPTLDLKIASSCDAADHMDWDYVFVRKYVGPEPAHGSWGVQEFAGGEAKTDSWWFTGIPLVVLIGIITIGVVLIIRAFKLRRKYRMAKGEEESL